MYLLCVTASHLSSSGSILLPPGPRRRLYTSSSRAGSLLTAQTLLRGLFAKSSCSGAFMPSGVWLHRGFGFVVIAALLEFVVGSVAAAAAAAAAAVVVVVPAGTLKDSGVEDEGEDSVAKARAQEVRMREAWRQRATLGRQD
ncbi:hypothetical protein MKX07_001396 [Trichoderma sp. CBMAI-0711]|nr:hypothetical protein MKX07_001396 [Trichoderma sp. CBMAI-0711]